MHPALCFTETWFLATPPMGSLERIGGNLEERPDWAIFRFLIDVKRFFLVLTRSPRTLLNTLCIDVEDTRDIPQFFL